MRGDWGGNNIFYFSGRFAARSSALCARFCGFAVQSSLQTADVFPVVASLRNLRRKRRMLSQATLSRASDKTAMLRSCKKEGHVWGIRSLRSFSLDLHKWNTIKIPLSPL